MRLTGISRKQAGVIYRNWKLGNIEMTQETVGMMYDFADFTTCNAQQCDIDLVDYLREAIDAIFANDFETAQARIDRFAKIHALNYC